VPDLHLDESPCVISSLPSNFSFPPCFFQYASCKVSFFTQSSSWRVFKPSWAPSPPPFYTPRHRPAQPPFLLPSPHRHSPPCNRYPLLNSLPLLSLLPLHPLNTPTPPPPFRPPPPSLLTFLSSTSLPHPSLARHLSLLQLLFLHLDRPKPSPRFPPHTSPSPPALIIPPFSLHLTLSLPHHSPLVSTLIHSLDFLYWNTPAFTPPPPILLLFP